ncbi:MAG: hypothetical protein ACSW8C_04755 [bacterium]
MNAVGQLTTNGVQYTPDTATVDKNKFAHSVSIASECIVSLGDTSCVSGKGNKTLLERNVTIPSKQEIVRMGSESYGKFRNFFVSLGQPIVHFFGDKPSISNTSLHSRSVRSVTNPSVG